MSFLVVSGTMLTCSYGTCSSKLKVTALALPDMSFELTLPSMDLGLGLGFGVDLSLPHGLFKKFDIHGNLAFQMNFDMGIMVGEYLAFDIMGRITQRLMFIGGKLYGMASLYAEGVLTAAINFEAGLMHGMSKFYDMYGRLAIQTNFNMGLEDGLRITFDVDTGFILEQALYIKGLLSGALDLDLEFDVELPDVSLDIDLDLDMDFGALATIDGSAIATIMDHVSHVNIRPFCYCTSRLNPAVAKATKRAKGKLKPQPCTPKTHSPWVPGSHNATMLGHASLTHTSTLHCAYAGVIHIKKPKHKKVSVP